MTDVEARPVNQRPAKPLFGSKLLWLAILATVAGLAWWIWAATQPAAPTQARSGSSPSMSGFVAAGDSATPAPGGSPSAPIPFQMGVSFMGGFFLAWAFRKFLKITLLIGGAIAVLIATLKGTGVLQLDWGAVESQVNSGLATAEQQVTASKDMLLKFLPSGGAAFVGMFSGARRG